MNFIYVFDEEAKQELESWGYQLLKADNANGVFVFKYEDGLKFNLSSDNFVFSNVLTF